MDVAMTPQTLETGKEILEKLRSMLSMSLKNALEIDTNTADVLLLKLPSMLPKLKGGSLEGARELATEIEDTLVKMEAWISDVLVPDYGSELEHILSYTKEKTMSADQEINVLAGKQLDIYWSNALNNNSGV